MVNYSILSVTLLCISIWLFSWYLLRYLSASAYDERTDINVNSSHSSIIKQDNLRMYRNILTRVLSTDIESIAGIPYVISVAIRRNTSNEQSEIRSSNSIFNKKNQTLSLINNSSNADHSERNVTQLSNLLPKEYYYPWNDGIDYDFICKSIKNKLDSFHAPPIIHKGFRGGLCHKVRSLFHSFTAALMMKRPLIGKSCDEYDICSNDVSWLLGEYR